MAHYRREILCPYLTDVYTVELLCSKLKRERTDCCDDISTLRQIANRKYTEPSVPNRADYSNDFFLYVGLVIIGLVLLFVGAWISESWRYFGFIGTFGGVIGCLMAIAGTIFAIGENKEIDRRYRDAVIRYNEKLDEIEEEKHRSTAAKESLPQYEQYYSIIKKRLNDAENLRNMVYSVNVIPIQYRNIKVANYLYSFFNTCQETDLEKIIQTFLLEEIRQKLDKIIIQNEEIIINQRMKEAADEERDRINSDRHREQMQTLAKMESNQQTQIAQQEMIQRNQEVTNFLLAADYLKDL